MAGPGQPQLHSGTGQRVAGATHGPACEAEAAHCGKVSGPGRMAGRHRLLGGVLVLLVVAESALCTLVTAYVLHVCPLNTFVHMANSQSELCETAAQARQGV